MMQGLYFIVHITHYPTLFMQFFLEYLFWYQAVLLESYQSFLV